MSVMNLNKELFQKLVIEEKRTVLVDFWAPWCTYCRRLEPAYDEAALQNPFSPDSEEDAGGVIFAKINIDEEPELADQYYIDIIPTLMLFQDGRPSAFVINPGTKAAIDAFLADNLPEEEKKEAEEYDVAVIGGGPAGYTAALYTARSGLSTVVLEQMSAGGQMTLTAEIDNYPGFDEGVDGLELGRRMRAGAERFGAVTQLAEVQKVQLEGDMKTIETTGGLIQAKAVVLATGANPRRLGLEGEELLTGNGVHYCAACDGNIYKGKTVIVVGGGNSAAEDALILSRLAEKVYVVHRRDSLRATKVYHEPLMAAPNVEFLWDSAVTQLKSGESGSGKDGRLTAVTIENLKTGESSEIECDGLFVSIGRQPASELFAGQVELDAAGYVKAGEDTCTSLPGVFAAGDLRTKALRQVITAAADGASASHSVEEYLAEIRK